MRPGLRHAYGGGISIIPLGLASVADVRGEQALQLGGLYELARRLIGQQVPPGRHRLTVSDGSGRTAETWLVIKAL